MELTLHELAALVDGRVLGDGNIRISGAAPMCSVQPGEITLWDHVAQSRLYRLAGTCASAVLTADEALPEGLSGILVEDLHGAFAKIIVQFRPVRGRQRVGISPKADVDPTACIGKDVDIHPFASVGADVQIGDAVVIHSGARIMAGSRIGAGTIIFPNAVLYEDTIVGPNCILHAGVILGAYGFGYCQVDGHHKLASQLGNVILGANVEVGAGATIDRGTYGPTVIGEGTKIDDQVMIAHNCQIGRHNMLCSQVGIAGSTRSGDWVVMAGQVGVRDHVTIGDGAILGAMAGVINDVPAGSVMIGIPATPEREQKIKQAVFAKLPEMRREMKRLTSLVEKLSQQVQQAEPAEPRRAA
jgi:UDP-3-O-[3-hydroxymyristoyl] glucosamine N-acyltransferase